MKPQILALLTAAAWGVGGLQAMSIGGEQVTVKTVPGMVLAVSGIILLTVR